MTTCWPYQERGVILLARFCHGFRALASGSPRKDGASEHRVVAALHHGFPGKHRGVVLA